MSSHSWSPSRTFSREGSASHGGGEHSSRSCSPSHSRKVDEDCQEEQSSIDFVHVVSQLCSLGRLPEALSEGCKIRGFMAALEDDNLPAASSYKMPIGGASADILADIDSRISSSSSGMHSRKVSKLLLYQGVRSQEFYRFEGEDISKAKALNPLTPNQRTVSRYKKSLGCRTDVP